MKKIFIIVVIIAMLVLMSLTALAIDPPGGFIQPITLPTVITDML
ncbi:MAG TPA: hypothetical protein VFD03_06770 [Clostridia bacterium]|nr:hypothetical protein [Clostridia bacterium]